MELNESEGRPDGQGQLISEILSFINQRKELKKSTLDKYRQALQRLQKRGLLDCEALAQACDDGQVDKQDRLVFWVQCFWESRTSRTSVSEEDLDARVQKRAWPGGVDGTTDEKASVGVIKPRKCYSTLVEGIISNIHPPKPLENGTLKHYRAALASLETRGLLDPQALELARREGRLVPRETKVYDHAMNFFISKWTVQSGTVGQNVGIKSGVSYSLGAGPQGQQPITRPSGPLFQEPGAFGWAAPDGLSQRGVPLPDYSMLSTPGAFRFLPSLTGNSTPKQIMQVRPSPSPMLPLPPAFSFGFGAPMQVGPAWAQPNLRVPQSPASPPARIHTMNSQEGATPMQVDPVWLSPQGSSPFAPVVPSAHGNGVPPTLVTPSALAQPLDDRPRGPKAQASLPTYPPAPISGGLGSAYGFKSAVVAASCTDRNPDPAPTNPSPAPLPSPAPSPTAGEMKQGGHAAKGAGKGLEQEASTDPMKRDPPTTTVDSDSVTKMPPVPPLPPEQQEAISRAHLRAMTKSSDGIVFIPGLSVGDEEKNRGTSVVMGCDCFVLEKRFERFMNSKDELLLLGIQQEYAERTHNCYRVVLSFFKAIFHVLVDHGIPKRQGFDVFRPDQIICLAFGPMNRVKLGPSATCVTFLALFTRFLDRTMRSDTAVTGALSLSGVVNGIGDVNLKIRAAKEAGYKRVVIPTLNYKEVEEAFKTDTELQVLQAEDAFELLNHCLIADHALPLKIRRPLDGVVPYNFALYGAEYADIVECCAFPGNGTLIVTGIEPADKESLRFKPGPLTRPVPRNDPTDAAAILALVCLRNMQEETWFKQLPSGKRRFDLRRMMITYWDKEAAEEREVQGSLHIHFLNTTGSASAFMGVSTAIAIAQVMRGYMLYRKVAALGEFSASGKFMPIRRFSADIFIRDIDLFLVAQHDGDGGCNMPRGPAELVIKGFSRLEDMLKCAFDEPRGEKRKVEHATEEKEGGGPRKPCTETGEASRAGEHSQESDSGAG